MGRIRSEINGHLVDLNGIRQDQMAAAVNPLAHFNARGHGAPHQLQGLLHHEPQANRPALLLLRPAEHQQLLDLDTVPAHGAGVYFLTLFENTRSAFNAG